MSLNQDICGLFVSIQKSDFNLKHEIDTIKKSSQNIGGLVFFMGQVRNSGEDDQKLNYLELEHYPVMTEKEISSICHEATRKWKLNSIKIIHRVGRLLPGDNIVLVIVASSHRKEAFKAAEFIMDFLKSRVPIWKKEYFENNSSWVQSKEKDEKYILDW